MECPKCKLQMTNTTPTKGYCMKCDILVHTPSGVAFTGDPAEDKFIGSPAVYFGEKKMDVEATAAPDSLVLTWKEGKTFGQKRLPYSTMTACEFGKRQESEVVSLEARLTGAFVGGGLLGIAAAGASDSGYVKTLIIKTKDGDHELYLPQPSDWADRLRAARGEDML